MITSELVAALAATIAAILSGIALWLGGAREERKWRRDELVDTFVRFLDASFASPGSEFLDRLRKSTLTDQDRKAVGQVHKSALTALTRLRVLASTELVKSAEELHLADDYGYAILWGYADLPDKETWDSHQTARRKRLLAMLTAARDELDLGEAVVPNPALFSPVTRPAHLQATNNDQ